MKRIHRWRRHFPACNHGGIFDIPHIFIVVDLVVAHINVLLLSALLATPDDNIHRAEVIKLPVLTFLVAARFFFFLTGWFSR